MLFRSRKEGRKEGREEESSVQTSISVESNAVECAQKTFNRCFSLYNRNNRIDRFDHARIDAIATKFLCNLNQQTDYSFIHPFCSICAQTNHQPEQVKERGRQKKEKPTVECKVANDGRSRSIDSLIITRKWLRVARRGRKDRTRVNDFGQNGIRDFIEVFGTTDDRVSVKTKSFQDLVFGVVDSVGENRDAFFVDHMFCHRADCLQS